MVALLISLKLSLLRGGLRSSVSQRIGLAVGALAGLGLTTGGVVGLVALRAADPDWAAFGVIVAGSVLVLGWAVIPMLVSGVDETLDPARFALLPVRARQLTPGLVLAGLIGVPGVATSVLALASLATWTRGPLPFLLAGPAAVLGVLTCVVGSRLLTTAAARLLAARRSREIGAVLTVLLLSSAGVWPAVIARQRFSAPDAASIAQVLGWTPLGLPWAPPADAATGHPGRAVVRLLLAIVLLAAATVCWSLLLDRALVGGGESQGTRARVGRSPLDLLPASPTWAVAARSLRYWRRDPRYVVAVTGLLVSATIPLIVIRTEAHAPVALLGAAPYLGVILGVATSNDVGYDGSAFAAHLFIGVPGRVDRWGRVLAVLCWAVPLILVAAVAGAVLGGRGSLWAGCVGAGLGGLLSGLGAGSLAGTLAPYPMPEAGSNPFRSRPGGSARAALAQLGVMSVTGTAAAPAIVLLVVSVVWWEPAAWIALPVGLAVGGTLLILGVTLGGRVLETRGPEILASVRRPD